MRVTCHNNALGTIFFVSFILSHGTDKPDVLPPAVVPITKSAFEGSTCVITLARGAGSW